MARLIISPSARKDLSEIFEYIARDKPIAAASWIDTVEQKCKLVATTPELGELRAEYGQDVRSAMVGRYVIFYRPIHGGVEIIRVISGDRDIRSL